MNNSYVYVLGLMSGTSLDGVDIVCVKFHSQDYKNFEILEAITYSYSSVWKQQLKEALFYDSDKLDALHIKYGRYLGKLINQFKEEKGIGKIDFIASHGHTIFHQPDKLTS